MRGRGGVKGVENLELEGPKDQQQQETTAAMCCVKNWAVAACVCLHGCVCESVGMLHKSALCQQVVSDL